MYSFIFSVLALALLCLGFVEIPSTLRPAKPALNEAQLPEQLTQSMEGVLLLLFAIDLALRYRYRGHKFFWSHRPTALRCTFVVFAALNVLLHALVPSIPRMHRLFRPVMLGTHLRNVSKILTNMVATVPRVAYVTVLLAFFIVFFGVFGHIMFAGQSATSCKVNTDGGSGWASNGKVNMLCSPFDKFCTDYFGTLGGSMNQLFVLLTTANYPDIMMPAYDCTPYAALFFVAFLMVGLYFIFNLILAVSYATFQEKTKSKVLTTVTHRIEALDLAYTLLVERMGAAPPAPPPRTASPVHSSAPRPVSLQRSRSAPMGQGLSAQAPITRDIAGPGMPGSLGADGVAVEMGSSADSAERQGLSQPATGSINSPDKVHPEDAEGGSEAGSLGGKAGSGVDLGYQAPPLQSPRPEMHFGLFSTLLEALRPDLDHLQRRVLFESLNGGGSTVSQAQFRHLPAYVEVKFKRVREPGHVPPGAHWLLRAQAALRFVVTHRFFVLTADLLVYLNALLIVARYADGIAPSAIPPLQYSLRALLWIFVAEMVLKLLALGVYDFFRDGFNILDSFVIPLAAGAQVALNYSRHSGARIVVLEKLAFLRIIRVLRALRALRGFGVIVRTFWTIVPMFLRYVVSMLLVYYVWAMAGMELFAGTITYNRRASPDPHEGFFYDLDERLEHTAYYESSYWHNNFNTLGRSMVTLFELMVVNNWAIIMMGYAYATSLWAMAYFYSWFFCMVIVVLNIVTAFLLDDFTVMQQTLTREEEEGTQHAWEVVVFRTAREHLPDFPTGWRVTRKTHPIHVYERMFEEEVRAYVEHTETRDLADAAMLDEIVRHSSLHSGKGGPGEDKEGVPASPWVQPQSGGTALGDLVVRARSGTGDTGLLTEDGAGSVSHIRRSVTTPSVLPMRIAAGMVGDTDSHLEALREEAGSDMADLRRAMMREHSNLAED